MSQGSFFFKFSSFQVFKNIPGSQLLYDILTFFIGPDFNAVPVVSAILMIFPIFAIFLIFPIFANLAIFVIFSIFAVFPIFAIYAIFPIYAIFAMFAIFTTRRRRGQDMSDLVWTEHVWSWSVFRNKLCGIIRYTGEEEEQNVILWVLISFTLKVSGITWLSNIEDDNPASEKMFRLSPHSCEIRGCPVLSR